jgi:hypothetical protein
VGCVFIPPQEKHSPQIVIFEALAIPLVSFVLPTMLLARLLEDSVSIF